MSAFASPMLPSQDRQLNFLIAVNLVVILVGTAISGGQFISIDNLQSMGSQLPELGFLALGITLSMISGRGGIDLSGVALANLAGITAALVVPRLVSSEESPVAYTTVFCLFVLSVGVLGGLLNGIVISKLGLTPILCTLGTSMLFTGISVGVSGGASVRVEQVELLSSIGNGDVFRAPISLLIFVCAALLLAWLLKRTPFGMRLYLMGTNPKAAYYTGIKTAPILITTYVLCGVLASTVGLISSSHTSTAKWDYGSSYLLIAILIAVMGGVNPAGGYGRIICVFLSATVLQLLSSIFNIAGVSQFFSNCAWGLLLLASLAYAGRQAKAGPTVISKTVAVQENTSAITNPNLKRNPSSSISIGKRRPS